MNSLVSLIVLVKNDESYINECLSSILKQTYENIEILIMNSNSKDNSMKICEYYKKKDKRIHIYDVDKNDNPKNVGISKSKGKYITFVDGKDRISKDYVMYLCNHIDREDADIVCVSAYENKKYTRGSLNYNIYKDDEIIENYLHMNLKSNYYGKLYKKSLFKDIEYPNNYFDDSNTTYKLYDKAKKVVSSDINMYCIVASKNYRYKLKDSEKMKKLDYCFDLLKYIEKEYPELVNFCKTKICYEAIDLFRNVDNKKYKKQLYNYIKIYRKYALRDDRFKLNKKILCIRSILGYNFMRLSFFLEDKI